MLKSSLIRALPPQCFIPFTLTSCGDCYYKFSHSLGFFSLAYYCDICFDQLPWYLRFRMFLCNCSTFTDWLIFYFVYTIWFIFFRFLFLFFYG